MGALRDAGCLFLSLTGGEVLSYPHLFAVMDRAQELSLAVQLLTNGTLLRPGVAARLASYRNLLGVSVSLYGATPEVHDGITQVRGSWRRTWHGIERIRALGIVVRLKFILMRQNAHEVAAMRAAAEAGGYPYMIDMTITSRHDGSRASLATRIERQSARAAPPRTVAGPAGRPAASAEARGIGACNCARGNCAMLSNGDVTPCISVPWVAGNVREQPFAEIWQCSPVFQRIRGLRMADYAACAPCPDKGYCARDRGAGLHRVWQLHGHRPLRLPDRRREAPGPRGPVAGRRFGTGRGPARERSVSEDGAGGARASSDAHSGRMSRMTVVRNRVRPRAFALATSCAAMTGALAALAAPFTDWRGQRPGAVHEIHLTNLPPPNSSRSVDNGPRWWPGPETPGRKRRRIQGGALRRRPDEPAADPHGAQRRRVRRREPARPGARAPRPGPGRTRRDSAVFAKGLNQPFGIAFYPPGAEPRWLYVANTDSVVRFPYRNGDSQARGPAETVVAELPGGGLLRGGGHWTRDIAFSRDGKKHVRLGRLAFEHRRHRTTTPAEKERADILEFDARRQRPARLRLRHPQRRRHRRPPAHGRAVGLGQRARRAGRQPGPRLHHARRGGRLLRLALVLHRRQPGSAPPRQAPRAEATR